MKVRYDNHNCAYLDDEPLPDGSYVGTNKYTDLAVHLRWDDDRDEWVEVCERDGHWSMRVGPVQDPADPDCSCAGRTPY